jgi:hypothetical protein
LKNSSISAQFTTGNDDPRCYCRVCGLFHDDDPPPWGWEELHIFNTILHNFYFRVVCRSVEWISELIGNKTFMASVDGKAMRNVKGENDLALMLVNVFAHDLKLALAEYPIKAKEGEPTVLKEALTQLFKQYPGLKILIGDAAFAGRELNEAIISLGRDYIAQIKENQPKMKKLLEEWFQNKIPKGIPAAIEIKKKVRRRTMGTVG